MGEIMTIQIRPLNEDACFAERLAARHHLSFHITRGYLYEHRGYKSEDREATDYEQEMWDRFVLSSIPEKGLDLTRQEFENCLAVEGAYYLNTGDYRYALSNFLTNDNFTPCTERDLIKEAHYLGEYRSKYDQRVHLFFWDAVPKGYYLKQDKLEFKPLPEMTAELAYTMGVDLLFFKEG